ncbi:MAG: hypothetical protein IIZ06_01755, partial [Kiritimatiellae bacterium]|nr:hypothetical protein [Kiritimatiellia bacterium]
MIRPIDIRLNAAHPELPLAEAVTFTGSPSTVLIRGVPPNCGRWAITAVFVAATYPDGSTTTRAAVQSANGVWVATLPATARSGRTENGLRVMADGIDENGAAVTGYILGVADFAVASLGVTPAPEPGETSWQMLYFDAVPGTLRKGDVAKVDGVLKLYNGTAWEPFAGDIPAPSTATPAMDGTGSAGSSAEYARGDHRHPSDTTKADKTYVDAKSSIKSPDGDTTVSANNNGTATISKAYWSWDVPVVFEPGNYEPPEGMTVRVTRNANGQPDLIEFIVGGEVVNGSYFDLHEEPDQAPSCVAVIVDPPDQNSGYSYPIAAYCTAVQATDTKTAATTDQIPAVVAPSTTAQTGKAADAKATGDALALIAPDWARGMSYAQYDVVKNNGGYYYAKQDTSGIDAPYIDTTNWGSLATLAAVAHLFLPLTGGTMTGRLDIEYLGSTGEVHFLAFAAGDIPNSLILAFDGRYFFHVDSAKVYLPVHDGTIALAAPNPTAGNLAALDASGNPTDAGWTAGELARYSLVTKTINNGAVTLDDRAINAVAVSSSLASLTVNFPTATSGKVRDFAMRLN